MERTPESEKRSFNEYDELRVQTTKHRLKEVIAINLDTMQELAEYLGISYQTLSRKMNGWADFSLTEIRGIRERYNLELLEIEYIFFND